jgi:tRNA dimethylallyltransferase
MLPPPITMQISTPRSWTDFTSSAMRCHGRRVQAVALVAHQRLARDLQHDAAGLAQIPPTPPEIRAEADARLAEHGPGPLLAELDPETAARIDRMNPVRVQRAWEVQRSTGRGLAAWQDETGPALLPLARTRAFVLTGPRDWLAPRIAAASTRCWPRASSRRRGPTFPAGRRPALGQGHGAADLIAYLRGDISLEEARERTITITRQYAKRQRTWFRARMSAWTPIAPD